MARKDFHFDFNEDADPVEELHRLRVATAKHFKTREALMEYYRSVPPLEEIRAQLEVEVTKKRAKEKAARVRKAAKHLTPA